MSIVFMFSIKSVALTPENGGLYVNMDNKSNPSCHTSPAAVYSPPKRHSNGYNNKGMARVVHILQSESLYIVYWLSSTKSKTLLGLIF